MGWRSTAEGRGPGLTTMACTCSRLCDRSYIVGTGNTGIAGALAVCGGLFGMTMFTCGMTMRRPHASYKPDGFDQEAAAAAAKPSGVASSAPAGNVHVSTVMKTPQYVGPWTCLPPHLPPGA